MSIYLRPDRVVFRYFGPDAEKLLNDVITGFVRAEDGPARWWALLSPQGKIQAEGLLGWHDGAFWLDVDRSVADSFAKRMRMYRLRARVDMEDLRESYRVGWSAEQPEAAEGIVAHADHRAEGLGWRLIAPAASTAGWIDDEQPFRRARVGAGIAELGPDFAADTTFAHDIAMDILEGIDFGKGCYVGQEVVSRMKHRGTARRRPVLVSGAPEGGSATISAGDREAGTLGTAVDGEGLGIVRLDRIADPAAVRIADSPVRLSLPQWATYAFGESSVPD